MASAFKGNQGAARKLAEQPDAVAGLQQIAAQVAQAAQAAAPNRTGYYARRFRVVTTGNQVSVVSTDPFAHLVEFGSANNPPYAPLRRGVRASGLKFQEQPKP